jgi:hypothetical protein
MPCAALRCLYLSPVVEGTSVTNRHLLRHNTVSDTVAVYSLFLLSVLKENGIIIIDSSFMQGIYTYIPETNHVPREHCVATILM